MLFVRFWGWLFAFFLAPGTICMSPAGSVLWIPPWFRRSILSGKIPLGSFSLCWFSDPGAAGAWFPSFVRERDCAPELAFASWSLRADSWTCCPYRPETITRFEFLRCKNYVTAPEINSPRGPNSPEITVRKSFKSPVRITAPKNNSKRISVMQILRHGAQN